jgi:uncharacterized protein Usg
MIKKDVVSKDFRKQVSGYGLTTAEIVYRRPDRHWLLQTYVWQDYDMFPNFPALKDFLAFWEAKLEGPLLAVTVAHSKLIKPADYAPWTESSGCINGRAQSFGVISVAIAQTSLDSPCRLPIKATYSGRCNSPPSFVGSGELSRAGPDLQRQIEFH